MPSLTVSERTYDRVTDLAHAWGISEDTVIVRLIDFWKKGSLSFFEKEDEVPIHALYSGHRAEGVYDPSTGLVDIVSGPGAGNSGLKPSPAAAAVISAVKPEVSVSRNGWRFWIVDATGGELQSLRAALHSKFSS